MQARRTHRKEFGGTGFVAANTRREWAFYDKIAEMRKRRKDVSALPANVARGEYRQLTGERIYSTFGTRRLRHLLDEPSMLADCCRNSSAGELFKHQPPPIPAPLANGADALQEFYRRIHGRQWPSWLYKDRGMMAEIEEFGSVETAAMWRSPDNPRKRKRIERMLRKTQQKWWTATRTAGETRTMLVDLYRELQSGFLAT